MTSKFGTGIWRLADPKISITSAASMAIGASIVALEGDIDWLWLIVTGLAFFCMEVAKNAWGDVYDYDSGTDLAVAEEDRTDFSGGKRVLVDELLSRRQTWAIAFVFGGAGLVFGAGIVFLREPMAFWIGAAGLFLGWCYHGPPLQLAYRGWGELDVLLIYGPVIALSTYLIQTHQLSMNVFLLSLPLGIFILAFLWVNEFPDYAADISAGKRNLVVKLGRFRASRVLPLIYLSGFTILLMIPGMTNLGAAVWCGFIALPSAILASFWVWRRPETFYRVNPVQPVALLTFVLYPVGICIAVYLMPLAVDA
jgi:1,4-dihydroxy-2-naphthoate octaprenyltransferase